MFITRAMQVKCNAILFLPDWTDSRGAMREYDKAIQFNQKIYFDINDVPSAL